MSSRRIQRLYLSSSFYASVPTYSQGVGLQKAMEKVIAKANETKTVVATPCK
jgi:hypothetical protein